MIVDFHSHTLCSDGSLEPQELADMMAERGVEAYSITDHDTLAAYGRFTPHAGARVIEGTEINTYYRNSEVHVLGYGLRIDDPTFAAFLVENREHRLTRAQRMVEQLRAGGYAITMADVERHAQGSKVLGRPHVARALVANGLSSDIEAAFRGLLRRGRPGFVPSTFVTPQRELGGAQRFGGGMGQGALKALAALPRLLGAALRERHRGDDLPVGLLVADAGLGERGPEPLGVLDSLGEPVAPGGEGLALHADAGDHCDQGGALGGHEAGGTSTPGSGGAGSKLV